LFLSSSDDRSLTGLLIRSFPRIHFPLATLSPIVPVDRVQHEMNDVANITAACFQRGSQMINCDPVEGKYSTPFLLDLRQL
jgi:tubulin alpha